MRSTGEVMGIDRTFGVAFAKSQAAVGNHLPDRGSVFMSLADRDKPAGLTVARRFVDLGFTLVATAGTATVLEADGIPVGGVVAKIGDEPGARGVPENIGIDAVDLIASGKVNLVVNTPRGYGPRADGAHIRRAASTHGVPCLTTMAAALAAAAGIAEWRTAEHRVRSLQEYHADDQLRLL
jgi:carbamoyl-phosphate synthase large subunit